MKIITCQNMRRIVSLAALLMAAGVLLLVLSPVLSGLPSVIALYAALPLIVLSPLVMLFGLLLSLLPGSGKKLEHCIL